MNQKPSFVQAEPAMTAGGVAAVVGAIMAGLLMAVSLGWIRLSPEQLDAIRNFLMLALPLVTIVSPLAVAWFTRARVVPVAKLPPAAQAQVEAGEPVDPTAWNDADPDPLPTGYGREVGR